jgi:hypothetical protein
MPSMRRVSWLLYLSGLLMVLYAIYASWSAFAQRLGVPVPIRLSEVGEFWLFFLSILMFSVHILADQRHRRQQGDVKNGETQT